MLIYIVQGIVLGVFLTFGLINRNKLSQDILSVFKSKHRRPSSVLEKGQNGQQGTSVKDEKEDFVPMPTPLEGLTPENVKDYDDRPWRPFRWPYHQTMSIFKLDVNHWLDMDKWYIRYIEEKKKIFHENPKVYCDSLPEGEDACEELLELVVDHMLLRYPNCFKKVDNGIHNLITDEIINLQKPYKDHHPLTLIGKLAKEDFYIVKKRDDGLHYLVAAAVPFPGGYFTVRDKLGKNLDVIHDHVPYYKEKLKVSMERWFARMKAADPVERASWYISWDHELLASKVYQVPAGEKMPSTVPFEKFNVRIERQTLRRLPKSQAIIFTNHPVFYSIDEMKDEPMIPSILKNVILEGPDKIIQYKNFAVIQDHIVPYLDRLIQRQIDLGIIKADDPVKTLNSYPFAHWVKSPSEGNGWTNPVFRPEATNKESNE